MIDSRTQFARTAADLVAADPSVAMVYAEISGQLFGEVERRHPERVVNVGIREQLLISVGAGMALAGLRPIVHTFGSFLVERPFEQIKLDFAHQGVGGVLVGSAGSFDIAAGGRTHQSPGDVALLDTLPDISIHAPSSAAETDAALRWSMAAGGLQYVRVVGQTNEVTHPFAPGRMQVVRRGAGATVIAVGPVLDAVLAATADRDSTVLYTSTVRPFDHEGLRTMVGSGEVVLVEPWLTGTSARHVADALRDRPHRLLTLGVAREEHRHYGTPEQHIAAHGLDAAGIAHSLDAFLGQR